MPSSQPSVAELRAVCQPPELVGRRSAEHWAGRLYMRRLSPYATRLALRLPVTPNGWTVLMIAVGVAGAAILAVPGLGTAVLAAVAVQLYLLLDCVDGEVARWRRATSAAGVYLDRLGHYTVEAALLIALGVRVDGGYGSLRGATMLGLLAAVLALLSKVESDLVVVARTSAGLPATVEAADEAERAAPRHAALRDVRRVFAVVPIHRLIGGIELSLLAVVAAVVDTATDTNVGSSALLIAAVAVGAIVALGHPVSVLNSRRLSGPASGGLDQ
ncbi:MAG: CDP-alcohol phosphatidyltransferase family protein [Actinobacteria bacterium]|nr:CDP-alcohol phosphatidyltransferase family protein [Actinomycetota bacterium]